jgi:hypothetical protein
MDSVVFGSDITTLLDTTPRDFQDNSFFPLDAETTWWLPTPDRKVHPFTLSLQQHPFRGPTSFGQRFTFDVPSVGCGDILLATCLQIELGHWLDDTTLCRLQNGKYTYAPGQNVWNYSNSLGTVIIEKAELEVNGVTIESIDGDFINVHGLLGRDIQTQYGISVDGLGRYPFPYTPRSMSPFPTESGSLCIPLSFFFQRIMLKEGFPLLAVKQGSTRIHITLRPFEACIVSADGTSPLGKKVHMLSAGVPVQVNTSLAIPQFKKIQLITYGAHTQGSVHDSILRTPFEILTRRVETFSFLEPLKYSINTGSDDIINVQLPLEINHPMEEIIWFLRRKASTMKNDYVNYSAITGEEFDPVFNKKRPLLQRAAIYLNGTEIVQKEENWFRQHIASLHPGGIAAYSQYIYGYSFSRHPGKHQPSGTANASKLQTVKLSLSVQHPGGNFNQEWEVIVYVVRLNWLRFQNGIASCIYMD